MCELLGMSANHPSDINRTLGLFGPRGGKIAPHGDGWGLAYYEGKAARVFKECNPAAESRCLDFIAQQNYLSRIVVGHIRKANPATVSRSIANTHPFQRELFGRSVVFAHNGILPGVSDIPLRRFHPLGETDSEWAFCHLLDRLAEDPDIFAVENFFRLHSIVSRTAESLGKLGEFNFLLSEGRNLFAFGHTNLHAVSRVCRENGCDKKVVLLATEPITDAEPWQKLPGDRVSVFREGVDFTEAGAFSGLLSQKVAPDNVHSH